jgi:hypothetical protein
VAVLQAPTSRSTNAVKPVPAPARTAGHDPARPPTRRRPVSAPRVLAPVACDHRRAPISLSLVIALAVAVCLAVIGLAVLANAGAGSADVPQRTAVVRIEPGESLLQLAERVAPRSDPGAVVDRIRELNGLSNSAVRPGQPLTVPVE